MKKVILSLLALSLLLPLTISAKSAEKDLWLNKDLYTKFNMRFDPERKSGSYIQYIKLTLLPANSKVQLTKMSRSGFKMKLPSGEEISVTYRTTWGGKPLEDILPTMFSESSSEVKSSLAKLREIDKKGVREGHALKGMSRNGVIAALGPPALHQTSSIEADRWTYWHSRFIMYHVVFANGKVTEIGSAGAE